MVVTEEIVEPKVEASVILSLSHLVVVHNDLSHLVVVHNIV